MFNSNLEELLEELTERADQTNIADVGELHSLIERADLVFGIWNEADTELGAAYNIIKGEGILEMFNYTGVTKDVGWAAVRCRSNKEAFAIRDTFGDGSRLV